MKILELRFKNLNSLYGEWSIDFTSPEYMANGIFAIIGPTGAGKSTILDAICLALYGTTPRMGKITKSGNEIMSRQTGECFSEVVFESSEGTYKCHWSQHRARKKSNGKLAESRHEISDFISNQLLESKKREVATVIEQKTGMDFERFTRSILLAQGGFDTFLKADSDQRAPILEQITGTEIYSEISKRVHERQRSEKEKLELLQAEISGISLLNEEDESRIKKELDEKAELEAECSAESKKIEKSIQWLTGIDTLNVEIKNNSQAWEDLSIVIEEFKPEQEKLINAQKAADLNGEFATLKSLRKQQQTEQDSLKAYEIRQPEMEAVLLEKETSLENSESLIQQAKTEKQSSLPTIKKVRLLDSQIKEKEKTKNKSKSESDSLKKQLEDRQTQKNKAESKLEGILKDQIIVQEYLSTHASDEVLITQMAGIEEKLNNLQSVYQQIETKSTALKNAQQLLVKSSDQFDNSSQELEQCKEKQTLAETNRDQKQTDLSQFLNGRPLAEYRLDKDHLQEKRVLLSKIADMESDRKALEDGKDCPLCGSKDHPYARGNVPEMGDTEKQIKEVSQLIKNAELLEENISDLELLEKDTVSKLHAAQQKISSSINDKDNAEKQVNDIVKDQELYKDEFEQLKTTALIKLKPFNIKNVLDLHLGDDVKVNIETLVLSLKARLDNWQLQSSKKVDFDKQANELVNEINTLKAVIDTQTLNIIEKQKNLDLLKKASDEQTTERTALFGLKNPDKEEKRLDQSIIDAETSEKLSRTERDNAKEQSNSIKVHVISLKKNISQREPELQTMESVFVNKLNSSDFVNEQDFLLASMEVDDRKELNNRAKELESQLAELITQKTDRETRLNRELDKKITDQSKEILVPIQKDLEEMIKNLGEEVGALKKNLIDNKTNKERVKEKQSHIDAQKEEFHRFEVLHGLIGSADGKKYRNFTQGLTFELMVSHANRQLEKMSDRYLLIRDNEKPLELNVIDNYQAGEVRSTKNLSGGESFIVSLSLALGLSKMASKKVRVDSLFLDEGFGTLDEDALESALETLSGLQQDGKLIGIISHVSALKERISTQINVIPDTGGKSIIKAPGLVTY